MPNCTIRLVASLGAPPALQCFPASADKPHAPSGGPFRLPNGRMTLQYSFERLSLGVETLAACPGPVKARLAEAFHRSLCGVVSGLLPTEARDIWDSVWGVVTAVPSGDRAGTFDRSIENISDEDAVAIVHQILEVERLVRIAIAMDSSPDVLIL
jgi:hypothetical protein